EWLDPPPESSWSAAEGLLHRLGAVDGAGAATAVGREMAVLPLHPRLSRMVLEAERRGAGEAGCVAAAVISSGERLTEAPRHHAPSDVLVLGEREWQFGTKRAFDQ